MLHRRYLSALWEVACSDLVDAAAALTSCYASITALARATSVLSYVQLSALKSASHGVRYVSVHVLALLKVNQ